MTTDKTPATLAVDVLAVMDRLRSEWRDESQIVGRWDSADALDAVHAAVAELIRESEKIEDSVHKLGMTCGTFSTALARVKGESA